MRDGIEQISEPVIRVLKETASRCPTCHAEIMACIEERDDGVWMRKTCSDHGEFNVRIAGDSRFYHISLGARDGNTGVDACCNSNCGCGTATTSLTVGKEDAPDDPFEVMSTCIALIEIVDSCNLTCPTCYAASPFGINDRIDCTPVQEFIARVEGVLNRKGYIDILQLSGGEPTIHPQFFEILEWSIRDDRIGYILINTNAVRIATDVSFREELGRLRRAHGKFELYMQFDGPQQAGQVELRAADLRDTRRRAIDEAGAIGIPTTLAMTVTPVTIEHLGDTLRFGLERPHVRGITFQPMFTSGRVDNGVGGNVVDASRRATESPISVGDVINNLIAQSAGLLAHDDFTPLPCGDPNCHTIGYLIRTEQGPVGIGSLVDLKSLQGFLENRVDYRVEDLAACGCDNEPLGELLKQFEIGPDGPFRIFIKPFMDAWTFDQDRIDRCCTHVIRKDGSLDSFCRYYLEQQQKVGHR